VLGLVLVGLTISYTLERRWAVGSDIWEHAAAARELSANPLHPSHPLFDVEAPHQFYSPYLLALGVGARVTGLPVTTVVSWAAVPNLLLLLLAFWLFVTRVVRNEWVPFYGLLLVLFLWGAHPWFFSGFLAFEVLPFVLSYPSAFAKALALIGLALHATFLRTGRRALLVPVLLIGTAVSITHPADAVALYLGVGALAVTSPGPRKPALVATATVSAGSFLLALGWPYFPLGQLLFAPASAAYRAAIAADDRVMYVDVLPRVLPALVVLPLLARRAVRVRRDPLLVLLVGLLLAYTYGWISRNWSFGRLIADIMIVAAVILAEELVRIYLVARTSGRLLTMVGTAALLLYGVWNVADTFHLLPTAYRSVLPVGWAPPDVDRAALSDFSFLRGHTVARSVVIADPGTALAVPAFGGRTVWVPRPEAFIDAADRQGDVARFFAVGSSDADRRAVLCRYHVSFLLLSSAQLRSQPDVFRQLLNLGVPRYRNSRFVLVDVRVPVAHTNQVGGGTGPC
jgi:hypothetical protein